MNQFLYKWQFTLGNEYHNLHELQANYKYLRRTCLSFMKKLRLIESGRVTFILKMFMTTSTRLIYLIQEKNNQEAIDVRGVASVC